MRSRTLPWSRSRRRSVAGCPRSAPLALALLATIALAAPSSARAGSFASWGAFYDAFATMRPDSSRVALVSNLMIERDAGFIVLEQGRLALLTPLSGRPRGAIFAGKGTLSFTPRTAVEREQLQRFTGSGMMRRPFRALVMLFADSTLDQLQETLEFRADTVGALRVPWREAQSYLKTPEGRRTRPMPVALTLLENRDNGLFWGMMLDDRSKPVTLMIDPYSNERVKLLRRPEDDHWGFYQFFRSEVVNQFHAEGDADSASFDDRPTFVPERAAISTRIGTNLKLACTADITVRALSNPCEWLAFWLHSKLAIDSVAAEGRRVTFDQDIESNLVWVRCDPPIESGTTATLRFVYRGEVLGREGDWIYHRATTDWYPSAEFLRPIEWDLRFEFPRDYQLLASGVRTEESTEGAWTRSRWISRSREPLASFDLNFFSGIEVSGPDLVPLTVWTHDPVRAGKVEKRQVHSLDDARTWPERAARDVARCLEFYRRQWGEPPISSLHAVETALTTFEAYAGLVHIMPREGVTSASKQWSPDLIRAHEVAHQWWGIGVAPATYRDAWLSEAFANFSSIYYLQAGRNDAGSYLEVLEEWRKRLVSNRKYVFEEGQEAGPIALGPRTNSSATAGDYDLVIYARGGWVLHMLRNLLLDPGSSDETRFRALLHDFYRSHAGGSATTADFRAAAEKAAGEDLGWFFRQWVEGVDVPTYKYQWSAEPDGSGWKIKGRIDQSNVPDSFRMPMFVRLELPDRRFSRQRVWVTGPVTEFEFGGLPEKPSNVVFNELQSVLCEVAK